MAKRIALSLLAALVYYVSGAFLGGWLVSTFSSNQHDRSLEAAMTGAFACGPFTAVVGLVAALLVLRRRAAGASVASERQGPDA